MENNTGKKSGKPAEKPQVQTTWEPNPAYLRSVTKRAAVRENRYVDRKVVEDKWEEANKKPEPEAETEN